MARSEPKREEWTQTTEREHGRGRGNAGKFVQKLKVPKESACMQGKKNCRTNSKLGTITVSVTYQYKLGSPSRHRPYQVPGTPSLRNLDTCKAWTAMRNFRDYFLLLERETGNDPGSVCSRHPCCCCWLGGERLGSGDRGRQRRRRGGGGGGSAATGGGRGGELASDPPHMHCCKVLTSQPETS